MVSMATTQQNIAINVIQPAKLVMQAQQAVAQLVTLKNIILLSLESVLLVLLDNMVTPLQDSVSPVTFPARTVLVQIPTNARHATSQRTSICRLIPA